MFGLGLGSQTAERLVKQAELETQMKISALQNAAQIDKHALLQKYAADYRARMDSVLMSSSAPHVPKFDPTWKLRYELALTEARSMRFAGEM